MLKYDFMKYRHRLLYYKGAPIYIKYTLYTTFVRSLYHSLDRTVAASRPCRFTLRVRIPSEQFCLGFFLQHNVFVMNFGQSDKM